ncbi:hypothetical protein [Paraglaciecola sp. 20A4]|uniref:hypothetical protein n=1 Tax=Paraglaciecola sp. 20A4 TaxID=2687288 RepID=UPI001F106F26|nr:hypothetical protein [Paraglaciecola sp. 20A4]
MIWNTQTSHISTRKFVITLISLSVALSLSAYSSDYGAQGSQSEMGTPGNDGHQGTPSFITAQILLSNNRPENADIVDLVDLVDLVDKSIAELKTFSTGNNEGIALDPLNNLVHAGDATAGSLRFLCALQQRGEDDVFNSAQGREITGAHSAALVLNGMRISVFGSAAADDVAPLAETLTDAKPWDLDYDEVNDRLFVALTDGTIAIYDDYVSGGFAD